MRFDELLFRLFMFWYICGIILLSFDILPKWLEWANAVFLILAGCLAVIYFFKVFTRKNAVILTSIIFLFTFFIEFLGSGYDILFGQYYYTEKFGFMFFDVPLTIGFAWLMVMGTSHVLAQRIVPKGGFLYAIVGGLIAVIIDLIIDPIAFEVKQYWIWEETSGLYYGIPFTNFLGWFLVAFILHLVILVVLKKQDMEHTNLVWEKRMILLFILMITMFVLLGVVGKLWLASSITTILASITLLLAKKRRNG